MLPQQVVGLHLSQLLVSPRLQSWMDWDSKDFEYVDLNILGWGLNGIASGEFAPAHRYRGFAHSNGHIKNIKSN